MAEVTIRGINRKLQSIGTTIRQAYNDAGDPKKDYIAQILTLVGLKEGYRFYEDENGRNGTLLTLTQDVNPSFERRSTQDDKSVINDYTKATLIFGTSQALHDRNFNELPNGAKQENANYSYGTLQAQGLNDVSFALNGSTSGYNPQVSTTSTSEGMSTHLSSLCGDTSINGEYPFRYVTNGAPKSIYNMAAAIEGKETATGSFKSGARTLLSAQNYDPVGGVRFTGNTDDGKTSFAQAFSTIEGFDP